MSDTKKTQPTEEELWAGPSGDRWLANAVRMENTLWEIGEELIRRAGIGAGEHVLEVGCGAGGMSLDMAARVGPRGSVTGTDISPALVAEGNRRAQGAKPAAAVRFVLGDAAKTSTPTKVDVLVSRFGVMFFSDPYAAFAHLRGQVRVGGRLAMAVWKPIAENVWMLEMRKIMAAHFELPTPVPRAAGPYAFDDPEYFRDVLTKAGFAGIEIASWQKEMYVGGPGSSAESAGDYLMQVMSVAQKAVEAPPEVRQKVRAEVVAKLKQYETPGGVKMPAAVWFATGRA